MSNLLTSWSVSLIVEGRVHSLVAGHNAGPVGQPFFRVVRASMFAAACVTVSLLSHLFAGGQQVRPMTFAGATVLTGLGAFALAGRRCGLAALLAACFTAQYGMHRLFSLDAHLAYASAEHDTGGLGAGLGMMLAHGVVALLTAWWLERGESALAMLLHLLSGWVLHLWVFLAAPSDRTTKVGLPAFSPVRSIKGRLLASVLSGRGPPPQPSIAFS